MITTTDDLRSVCTDFLTTPFVTIDTEFMREQTYYPHLCLIQIASQERAVLIDPLSDDLDLGPLFDVLRAPDVLKVFHAARQDLEIFYYLTGDIPGPLFDTQIAAMVCGHGDQIAYDRLVQTITGIHIDKSSRLMDWTRRPLTAAQHHYAIGDVTHLRTIYLHLSQQLEDKNRLSWIREEVEKLCSPKTYRIDPEDAYKRIKTRTKNQTFTGLLRALASWREQTAQTKNIPRNRILRDESLIELAAHPPKTPDDIEKVRGIPKGWARSPLGKTLLAAIETGKQHPCPPVSQSTGSEPRKKTAALMEVLKTLLKVNCSKQGVASKLVASGLDLEKIASHGPKADTPALTGWRYDIFGRDALALFAGQIALTCTDGGIVTIPVPAKNRPLPSQGPDHDTLDTTESPNA